MFRLRVDCDGSGAVADARLMRRLETRAPHDPATFAQVCKRYMSSYGRFGYVPDRALGAPPARSYALAEGDDHGAARVRVPRL